MNSKSKKEISKSIQTFNVKINFVFGDMWGNFPGVEFEGMFPRGEININRFERAGLIYCTFDFEWIPSSVK